MDENKSRARRTLSVADGVTHRAFFSRSIGQPGRAQVDSQFELGPFTPNADCPAQFPVGGGLIRFEWVETYNDGSLLTGSATEGLTCADGLGGSTSVVSGNITGGTGRFEGAVGTWEAEALVANNGLTGSVTADFG